MSDIELLDFYISETWLVTLTGLKEIKNNTYINDATVTYTLQDIDGNSIATGSLTYVSGSDGNYTGLVDYSDTANLSESTIYYLDINITSSTADGKRRIRGRGVYRGAT